jgi:uncharacterized protein with HEPN domain
VRDPRERLHDIVRAIEAILRYARRGRAAFAADELLQTWVVHHLEIIGEAARAIPEDVRAKALDVPWTKIVGMRNILVHGCFDIDADVVWEVVARDLPESRRGV